MNRNDGDCVTVDVWWTPDCGYLHLARDPVVIEAKCSHQEDPEDA